MPDAAPLPEPIQPPGFLPSSEITSSDRVRAAAWLRGYVERYPALRALLRRAPRALGDDGQLQAEPASDVAPGEGDGADEDGIPAGVARLAFGAGVVTLAFGRYRDTSKLFDAVRLAFYDEAAMLANGLASGRLTVTEFEQAARLAVKYAHVSAAVAARGGEWKAVTFSEWGRVGNTLRRQYEYLSAFASELRARLDAGEPLPSEGKLRTRLGLYADAARQTYEAVRTSVKGFDASLLPAFPGDGTTKCLTRCKCRWDVKPLRGIGNYNVSWRLGRAEHCPTCLERSRRWGALKVRRGEWVDAPEPIFYRR